MQLRSVRKKIKKLLKKRAVIAVVFVFFIAGALTYVIFSDSSGESASALDNMPAPSLSTFVPLENIDDIGSFNVLLLGYGGAGHEGGYLTDVIMLVHFDFKQELLGLISIPRDLWVTKPNGKQSKINAAFIKEDAPVYPTEDVSLDEVLEGAVKTKSVIQDVTGLTPHFFVGIDFNQFVAVIDQLGGVDVDVPQSFDDPWYPVKGRELELCGLSPEEIEDVHAKYSGFELERQFDCRYEKLHFEKGKTHMNGETVLKFVRSRHSSTHGGDFARSQRQQAVLIGLKEKMLSKKILEDPIGLYKKLNKSIQTNLNENLINNLVPLISNIGRFRVVNINLSDENVLANSKSAQGAFILVPKSQSWDSVQKYIAGEL